MLLLSPKKWQAFDLFNLIRTPIFYRVKEALSLILGIPKDLA